MTLELVNRPIGLDDAPDARRRDVAYASQIEEDVRQPLLDERVHCILERISWTVRVEPSAYHDDADVSAFTRDYATGTLHFRLVSRRSRAKKRTDSGSARSGSGFVIPVVEGESLRDGRYWTRTSDPCGVNTVLYQLS